MNIDDKTKSALKVTGDHFRQFSRNGRWGTCADCPRDMQGNVYPEFCEHTDRYDHKIGIDELTRIWKIYSEK